MAGNEPFLLLAVAKISSRCAGRGEGAPGGEEKRRSILHGSEQQQQHPLPAHQLLPHIQLIFPVAYEEHKLALTHAQKEADTHTHTMGPICNRAHSLPYLSILSHALFRTRTAADRPRNSSGERRDAVVSFFSSFLFPYIPYLASEHHLLITNDRQ